jgi:hypothetical protein
MIIFNILIKMVKKQANPKNCLNALEENGRPYRDIFGNLKLGEKAYGIIE